NDRKLRDPGDTPNPLQIRELGVIPSARSRRRIREASVAQDSVLALDSSEEEAPARTRVRRDQVVELTTWRRDQPAVAEAFCGTMNSFLLAQTRNAGVRSGPATAVVLTSPETGDGKTAVATNLAIALARAHRRVLLVDGDLRRPRLHKIFDIHINTGLDSILRGSTPVEELWLRDIVVPTRIPGLSVLPTTEVKGGKVPDLLLSERLAEVLKLVR